MPLPTLTKTYEFDINNIVPGNTANAGGQNTATVDRRQLLFGIVKSMINGANFTVPWTVKGSSDGVTAGMDGVDRWNSFTDVVWAEGEATDASSSSPHSWVCLNHSVLGIDLLISCLHSTNTYEGALIVVRMSGSGFGAASGGTNGTTTEVPTALSSCLLRDGTVFSTGAFIGGATLSARQWVWNISASNDGHIWNIFVFHNNKCLMFWRFERPESAPANWATKVVAHAYANVADSLEPFSEASMGRGASESSIHMVDAVFAPNTGIGTSTIKAISWAGGETPNNAISEIETVNTISGEAFMAPIWWMSTTIGARDVLGKAVDLWAKQATAGGVTGDTYPNNPATPQFIVLGVPDRGYVLPWDGVTAPVLS